MIVEIPHVDTDSVNFANGVDFFYPDTQSNRKVPNNPTFLLPKNFYSYWSPHSYFFTAPTLRLHK